MKRLVLDQQDKKVNGFCAGIANYLDVDVTVVRLIVLTVTIMSGIIPGVIVYLFGSAITPKGESHA